MSGSCWLFAANADPKTGLPVALLWTILIMTGVVLAAAAVITVVGRWAKRSQSGVSSSGEELASFRVLYERGEFSQEEYDRIRSRLSQKLRNELKLPTEKPAESAASEPATGNGLSAAPPGPTIDRPDSAGTDPDTSIKPG